MKRHRLTELLPEPPALLLPLLTSWYFILWLSVPLFQISTDFQSSPLYTCSAPSFFFSLLLWNAWMIHRILHRYLNRRRTAPHKWKLLKRLDGFHGCRVNRLSPLHSGSASVPRDHRMLIIIRNGGLLRPRRAQEWIGAKCNPTGGASICSLKERSPKSAIRV